MKKNTFIALVTLVVATTMASRPAAAADTKSQLVQIQTQLQIMQDNMTQMKQSFDERMGVMKDMITQQTDSVNKLSTAVQTLQKTVGQETADSGSKVDQISGQVQALHDAVDELKARLAKISDTLKDIQSSQQNMPSPGATQPQAPGGNTGAPQAPPAQSLYDDGLRDFNAGKYDLSSQEFTQYLQVYGNTDLAGNAQFYLGEIQYHQGKLQDAVLSYNKVLDQYPGGNKAAAAQLKKGFALLDLGQKSQGIQELRSLVARYPKSPEALQAKERLNKLGVAGATSRPSPSHR